MLNLNEYKDVIAKLVQRKADGDFQTEIENWINLSIQTLANSYDYWHELRGTHDFTTVDGTAKYFMPADFILPLRFYDITNNKPINILTEEQYFDSNIANIADAVEADADSAYFTEVVGVKVQVSTSGDTVIIDSSSTADTTQTVRVKGYLDSNLTVVGFEDISLNGTTNVAGTTTFYKILHFSKSADTTGFVTLQNSSQTALGVLGPIDRVARYKAFRLGRIPDDSTTNMRVLYKKRFDKLVDDNDYAFVEADDYIIYNSAALAINQEKEDNTRAQMFQKRASTALTLILSQQNNKMGSSFQHKMSSSLLQAHRNR